MEQTTYSFLDLVGSITHPSFGTFIFNGEGTGSVTVTKSTDRTAHDIASDGSVMGLKSQVITALSPLRCSKLLLFTNGCWRGLTHYGLCRPQNGPKQASLCVIIPLKPLTFVWAYLLLKKLILRTNPKVSA